MNKYKILTLLFLLVSYGVESKELTEAEQTQLNESLITATKRGDVKALTELIDKGADVNAKDEWWNWTALMYATTHYYFDISNIYLEIIKVLLDNGADINVKNNEGKTVLHLASSSGRHEVVKVLLDNKGADIDAKDNQGRTALMVASVWNDFEIVTSLVDKGAEINAKDKDGKTALMWAEEMQEMYPDPVTISIIELLKQAELNDK